MLVSGETARALRVSNPDYCLKGHYHTMILQELEGLSFVDFGWPKQSNFLHVN